MMVIEIISLFPGMFESFISGSLMGKARASGLVDIRLRDIRDYSEGKHRVCDDSPYGGGAGMLMKPGPPVLAIEAAKDSSDTDVHTVLLSPRGKVLNQSIVCRLAEYKHILLVCGRYEGVDERVCDYVDEEISAGDYVLSGGEAAAIVVMDAVCRFIPGVLGNENSVITDSFSDGLLKYPQYTRPAVFRGKKVPDILLSGDHAKIDNWRRLKSLQITKNKRPDLFSKVKISKNDQKMLDDAEEGCT